MGSPEDQALLREFLAESVERLAELEAALMDLEEGRASGEEDPVHAAFRAVHTIKGGAGLLGLGAVRDLAHEAENTLDEIRKGQRKASPETIDQLLVASDAIRRLLAQPGSRDDGSGTRATLRVRADVLDALMSGVAELILVRNQMRHALFTWDAGAFQAAERNISRIAADLQRAVLEARMQPLSVAFGKIPRLARDAARACGKQVEVAIEGADVELDRAVADRLSEPLAHIIRNAIAHGIENPEERVAAGKGPVGTIRIAASQRGGRVELTVSDDGRGFDIAAIRNRVAERGLRSEAELRAMTDAEVLDLAFLPNVSTAECVSNLAGRGVGLDAVRAAISALGGAVELRSRPGVGASVVLKLPLTLAILNAVILRVGELVCAAPESYVERIIRLEGGQLRALPTTGSAEFLDLGDEAVPLLWLERVLERDGAARRDDSAARARSVVLVSSGSFRYALLVDWVEEVQEIVLKSLGPGLPKIDCFIGLSALGDGRIALVLDLTAIARRGRVLPLRTRSVGVRDGQGLGVPPDREPLLVVSGFDGTLAALPLDRASHIERISGERIDRVGARLFGAFGGSPVELLPAGDLADPSALREYGEVFVVLVRAAGRRLGILSPRIPDAVESWVEGEPLSGSPSGAQRTVLAGGRIAALIDPDALAAPTDGRERESAEREEDERNAATILVVEDSQFLRKKICGLLRRRGYRTVEAGDGREALERLRSGAEGIHLVLTDLEMPGVDGFALATAIREDPELRDLPVIALSALTKEEDVARAYKAGVNEYLVKLDPERLVESVAKHLSRKEGRAQTPGESVSTGLGEPSRASV